MTRMPPALWAKLDALSASQGTSTNALLCHIAERVTGSVAPPEAPQATDHSAELKSVHFRVRAADRDELKAHAAAMGYSVTAWITALIRSKTRKAPVFAMSEIEGLMESTRALGAVGRNLNTVVHRLNREGRWYGNVDLYVSLLAEVKRLKSRVESVISSALDRAEE
ncbi:hypothetical protein [Xanthomonas arboricola]|uniref:hypothetical protein n=1 Tax=Xanthomonas arboricola TaxID=56448 RepID=UPI000AC117B2|nr:hypothetical protein [Xanthomonas arboricola]